MANRSFLSTPIWRSFGIITLLMALLAAPSLALVTAQEDASISGAGPDGNASRSRAYPGPGPEGDVGVLWKLTIPATYEAGIPVVFGDVVLVTATSGDFGSNLTAYDLHTGQFLWNHAESVSLSDPFVTETHAYLVQGDRRFALDVVTGEVAWDITLDDGQPAHEEGRSGRVVAGNGVVFTNHNRTLFALDGSSGEELWRRSFEDHEMFPPFLSGDVVVTVTYPLDGSGEGRIHGISIETGNEVWRRDIDPGPIGLGGSESAYALRVFQAPVTGTPATRILDSRDGQLLWRPSDTCGETDLGELFFDSVLCASTGSMHDAMTGDVVSEGIAIPEGLSVSAMIGDALYLTDGSSIVMAIDPASGAELWSWDLAGTYEGPAELSRIRGGNGAVVVMVSPQDDPPAGGERLVAVILGDSGTTDVTPAATPAT